MDEKLQNEHDDIDIMEDRNDDCVSDIEGNHDVDEEDELHDDEPQRAVLNGTTPTAIGDAGCAANCVQPTESMEWMSILSYPWGKYPAKISQWLSATSCLQTISNDCDMKCADQATKCILYLESSAIC